jgi:hypothetical protein
MNTPTNSTADYILLFRGPDWDAGLSPDETEQVMGRVKAWLEGLQARGLVKGGQPLGRTGRMVSGQSGRRTVADGPFAESKEAVGGYLVVQVNNIEEAVAIARACPTLDYNISIEVRPVLEECPISQRIRERQAFAAA